MSQQPSTPQQPLKIKLKFTPAPPQTPQTPASSSIPTPIQTPIIHSPPPIITTPPPTTTSKKRTRDDDYVPGGGGGGPGKSSVGTSTSSRKQAKSSNNSNNNNNNRSVTSPPPTSTFKAIDSEDYQYQSDDDNNYKPVKIAPKAAKMQTTKEIWSTGAADIVDNSGMILKPDHQNRPLHVSADGHIFLESFSPIYQQAYDFLVAIAEPESRALSIQEYQLTPYSLFAAVSIGLTTTDILDVLERLSKTKLPDTVVKEVRKCTESYGKVKLVLQKNRYFLESSYKNVLIDLIRDQTIADACVNKQITTSAAPTKIKISGGVNMNASMIDQSLLKDDPNKDKDPNATKPENEVYSVEVSTEKVTSVRQRCIILDFPTLEEYDFKNDTVNPNLSIDLKPTTRVRPYQEKCLNKMFSSGRARSGIIVLPCGAGKTLVGVTAAATIKKSCLVLCTGAVSVEQWRQQFKLWANVDDKSITRFTANQKEMAETVSNITITTYTMISYSGQRSKSSEAIMQQIRSREWGLLLMDEVHVVPAHTFQKVVDIVQAHCKLGLTATLIREDDKIENLNFLVGPKLYEANWTDLTRAGHLANVQCIEVWCSMTPEFYYEYLKNESDARRMLLYTMNPQKFRNCQFLINYHEARGDKIIVFSDNLFSLKLYALKLNRPMIYGAVTDAERMQWFQKFKYDPSLKTIFVSKVGDTSIDLPGANVIIQISSHFGARRQEAQRLGRILRPKARSDDEFNAFFYTLISTDTKEMYYSTKRQQFLIDQGYNFKVIPELPTEDDPTLLYSTKKEQLDLLRDCLKADESEGNLEEVKDDDEKYLSKGRATGTRTSGSARNLSGAGTMSYGKLTSIPKQSDTFKKLQKDAFKKTQH